MSADKRPFDIMAIDAIDMDIVMKVAHLPKRGDKMMGTLVGRLPGGPCANFACAAARLGMSVASFSTVGEDKEGEAIIVDFANYGVATDFVRVQKGGATPFTVIFIEPDGERIIIAVPTFKPSYSDEEYHYAFAQTRAIHTFPTDPARFLHLAKIARDHQTKVMFDVEATANANRQDLEAMLRLVDIASFNEQGFVRVAGEEATIEGARKLLAYGPEIVVVTLAERGALAVTAVSAAQVPGHTVAVQDTTGAGDTFNAAFLSAILQEKSLEVCLTFANAAAALSVTGLGPRGNLPMVAEVEAFLGRD